MLWRRLDDLVDRAQKRGLGDLQDEELDDLSRLYRAAANHLALLRTFGASLRQRERLNRLVTAAHAVIYGRASAPQGRRALLWALLAFPETVRRTARYHVLAAALLLLGGVYGYLGAARDPDWALEIVPAEDSRTPYASREELRATLLEGRPGQERALGEGEKALFAAFLWQHNTRVALLSFFSGFLAGVPTTLLVLFNGAVLGVYSHTFHAQGLAYEWWAWILPHGVTELLAIVLLSGGGLLVGRCLIAPGGRSRVDALREVRADLTRLAAFAFPMLLLAAGIESFVRQSGLSEPARYAFAAVSATLWALYLGLGRLPARLVQRAVAERSLAERRVALPIDEELLGLAARR